MLPYEYDFASGTKKTYHDFESLYSQFRKDGDGRHGFQLNWVKNHFQDIKIEYRRLHELSNESRYFNYQFESERIIPEINICLRKIRHYCKKNQKESFPEAK